MNSKLVDSLAQIIFSLTPEEQLYLKRKLSDYSTLKIVSNNVPETKNEYPSNFLEKKDIQKIREDIPLKEIMHRYRYDLLNRYGFGEGEYLLPEEVPLIETARDALVKLMGVVEKRWKPCSGKADCPYIYFEDLKLGETNDYYNMNERDRRIIDVRIDEVLE